MYGEVLNMIARQSSRCILILEDDDDLAEGITLSLQSDELDFTISKTIAKAKEAVNKQSFDLFI